MSIEPKQALPPYDTITPKQPRESNLALADPFLPFPANLD